MRLASIIAALAVTVLAGALGVAQAQVNQPAAAVPLVRQLASDATTPVLLRAAALDVAPGALGSGAPAFLVRFLRDPEARMRRGSAEGLAASGTAGCRLLLTEARRQPPADLPATTIAACESRLRAASSQNH